MKNYSKLSLAVLLVIFFLKGYAQKSSCASKVWVADNGDGTYKNPILFSDYSDPDVIRLGDDFYMTASSFNSSPALPILHSKDLVNWQIVNHALKIQQPEEVFNIPQHGKGVWAPSMVYHNNELRIYYGDPDFGIYMLKTKDPLGQWEKPVHVMKTKGVIDPSVLFDDDGKVYMVTAWAASRAGINSLLTVYPMNATGTKITGEGVHIYDGHGNNHTIEGPKLFKKNGYYYISAPAGGVETGWQVVLRAKNIYGPYEEKVVIHQGNTNINGPHQGSIVDTKSGESWFVHFQDKGLYGRILNLQPVSWKDGWPLIGIDQNNDGIGEPVQTYKKPNVGANYPAQTPAESDEFNNGHLGLQWQWHANKDIRWSASLPAIDYLRLFLFPLPKDTKNLWTAPNLLLQKFPAEAFTATTKLKLNLEWDIFESKKAGLLVMGNDYAYISVQKDEKGFYVNQVICKDAVAETKERSVEKHRLPSGEVYLRVKVNAGGLCNFSFSTDGTAYTPLGDVFQAKPDKWIGAKFGIFGISSPEVRVGGYADFDWLRVEQ
jgi:beta-xylosidase